MLDNPAIPPYINHTGIHIAIVIMPHTSPAIAIPFNAHFFLIATPPSTTATIARTTANPSKQHTTKLTIPQTIEAILNPGFPQTASVLPLLFPAYSRPSYPPAYLIK